MRWFPTYLSCWLFGWSWRHWSWYRWISNCKYNVIVIVVTSIAARTLGIIKQREVNETFALQELKTKQCSHTLAPHYSESWHGPCECRHLEVHNRPQCLRIHWQLASKLQSTASKGLGRHCDSSRSLRNQTILYEQRNKSKTWVWWGQWAMNWSDIATQISREYENTLAIIVARPPLTRGSPIPTPDTHPDLTTIFSIDSSVIYTPELPSWQPSMELGAFSSLPPMAVPRPLRRVPDEHSVPHT